MPFDPQFKGTGFEPPEKGELWEKSLERTPAVVRDYIARLQRRILELEEELSNRPEGIAVRVNSNLPDCIFSTNGKSGGIPTVDQKMIDSLCKRYRIRRLGTFGNEVNEKAENKILIVFVEFEPNVDQGKINWPDLGEELQTLFRRPVNVRLF